MKRLYSQFLGGWRGIGLLFIRLVLGTAFILHGWQKIENPLHWMDKAPNGSSYERRSSTWRCPSA